MASAGAEFDFTWLDEKLTHIPSAAAKTTSSAMPAILRIQPSYPIRLAVRDDLRSRLIHSGDLHEGAPALGGSRGCLRRGSVMQRPPCGKDAASGNTHQSAARQLR